ncbi:28S ribosomal protein S22, mitochondrial [Dufourea novaeangliae]|uniref:28S ribosomal protein S22, mitochondrial n=2 Tax=Dufourea novaeangliae TaxID=178035 RepID=A0A154NZ11_DUFNO|nr:28S ribosomal protein S22, mitochondrial [Dufourea novaeangliae]
MMSSRKGMILRRFYKQSAWNCRSCSSQSKASVLDDPAPFFFNENVQQLLKKLTRIDYTKVSRVHKTGQRLNVGEYKFMTDEELEQSRLQAIQKLEDIRLQMPPVVKESKDTIRVLVDDPGLKDYDTAKFVFTDISYGINTRDRKIVVREPTGTLRHARMAERNRITQVYFPVNGKQLTVPQMFYEPYLEDLLKRKEYVFILDRACLQFDPDDPEYHRITKEVYRHINAWNSYDILRSTRHFGPMVFYLVSEKKIDNLLVELLQSPAIDEAVSLVRLYYILHPDVASATEAQDKDSLELIEYYTKHESLQKHNVEHAVLFCLKLKKETQEMEVSIKKAHGQADTSQDNQNVTN